MKLNTFWTWILFAALLYSLDPPSSLSQLLFGISLDKFEDLSVRRLVDAPPAAARRSRQTTEWAKQIVCLVDSK